MIDQISFDFLATDIGQHLPVYFDTRRKWLAALALHLPAERWILDNVLFCIWKIVFGQHGADTGSPATIGFQICGNFWRLQRRIYHERAPRKDRSCLRVADWCTESRAFVVSPIGQNKKARGENEFSPFSSLILIENHAINHHVVARSDVMDPDWKTDFNSRSHDIFIQGFATPRHISDRLSEVVGTRPATFLEYDYTAWSVLRDRAVAFSCGRGCRGLRDLRPCEGSRNCQDHTE